MSYPLLSVDWIEQYMELWNHNDAAIDGTRGLPMIVEMAVTDQDRPPVQIRITEDGLADYAGPLLPDVEPRFKLTATTETWRKVGAGELGIKRAVTGPIAFKGSLMTALKHFKGLEAALLQFGDVQTTEWGPQ